MSDKGADDRVACIYHNAGHINVQEDPSFPFKMEANFRIPSFMEVAFVMLYGGSEIFRFQGMTVEGLVKAADSQGFSDHCRLRRIEITDRAGKVVRRKDSAREPWAEA